MFLYIQFLNTSFIYRGTTRSKFPWG